MAADITRLLDWLNLVDVSQLIPGAAIPASTCIQGRAKGITQQGRGLYITSITADYILVVDEPAIEDFSKALRATSIAVDVSGGKVVQRIAKLKGAVQVTEIEISLHGEIKVELLTKEKKRVQKVYLRKGATPKKATKVSVINGSPPPTNNSWASSSPDLPIKPLTKAKKLTERPLHTAIAPVKRKASPGRTNGSVSAGAAQAPLKPISAFKGIDQDLMAPVKKRKTSTDSEKSKVVLPVQRIATTSERQKPKSNVRDTPVAMEVDAPPVVSTRASEEIIMTAQAAPRAPATALGPAPAAQPTLPKPSAQVPPPAASPPSARRNNQGVNVVNGPDAASTSKSVSKPSASTSRQQMREKMEAKALAKRAAEQAEEDKKLKEAAKDIAVLEEGITVGVRLPIESLRAKASDDKVLASKRPCGLLNAQHHCSHGGSQGCQGRK